MALGHNGLDRETMRQMVARWERIEADHASERGELMQRVKDDKEVLLEEVEAKGLPRKVFKIEMGRRKGEAKAEKQIAALDVDERAQLDMFCDAIAPDDDEAVQEIAA